MIKNDQQNFKGYALGDKALVEDRIARAQMAVLSPDIDPSRFLSEDLETRGRSFTRDTVVVDVFGQELSDSTFVDLPGLISHTSDSCTKDDLKLVNDLVRSYISVPTSLIILVITCQSDFETQGSYLLAQQYDPMGERTIGVFTKPDRIEIGDEGQWLKIIEGQYYALKNGWFVVKQPTSELLRSRNYTWEHARADELEYFETTSPWSTVSRIDKKRLGVSNLANVLKDLYFISIQNILPVIRTEIARLIRDSESELEKYLEHGEGSLRLTDRQIIDKYAADIMEGVELEVSRTTTLAEIVSLLGKRGCLDMTSQLDLPTASSYPIASGGFGDIYRCQLKNDTEVAVKILRLRISSDERDQKILKASTYEILSIVQVLNAT
ncbi:dynamin central region protein [Ceratobasidium sp. AG-Ba]|nr:dynamin central region protein [Ceratobasidium sp. AG-Ba]